MNKRQLKATEGRLAAMPNFDDLKSIMECPVCFEILSPPIYVCQTGHAICNSCKPKLQNCVTCRKSYTDTRIFVLESMISAAKFYCDHRSQGCKEEGTEEELKKHHLVCRFRQVKCSFSSLFDECHTEKILIEDFYEHLKAAHKAVDINPNTGKQGNSFWELLCLPKGSDSKAVALSPNVLAFDGKHFVVRWSKTETIMNCGVYVIDQDTKSGRYGVKITIRPFYRAYMSHVPQYEISMTIPSIREAEKQPVVYNVSIPMPFLKQLGKTSLFLDPENIFGRRAFSLRWTPEYTLYKL